MPDHRSNADPKQVPQGGRSRDSLPPRDYSPPPQRSVKGAVIGVSVTTAIALTLLWLIARWIAANPDNVRLGDEVFEAGKASSLKETIAKDGPVLYPDLLGGGRSIFVQYDNGKFLAFETVAPDAATECQLTWDPKTSKFYEPDACGGLIFPANGQGLIQYQVKEEQAKVIVDLRSPISGSRTDATTLSPDDASTLKPSNTKASTLATNPSTTLFPQVASSTAE